MWLDAGLFFVVRREALLNGQARGTSVWSGAGPIAAAMVLAGPVHRSRTPNHVCNEP